MNTKVTVFLSVLFFICALLLAFNPSVKKQVFTFFNNDKKEILTTLSANLINSGEDYKIIKFKQKNKLLIEVYSFDDKKSQHIKVDQIQLRHNQDGFYKFGKEATNLFTTDLNNDGILEIIAPTYTPQLEPYMNIISLNPESKKLEWSSLSLIGF